jgi:hypothetical protein
MQIFRENEIIECLRNSLYYQTFSRIVEGERVIKLPKKFIITNN